MPIRNGGLSREAWLGGAALGALVALTGGAVFAGAPPKVVWISWVAFAAMAGAAVVGARVRQRHPRGIVWGYGLAAGAMVTSAAAFLLPPALGQDATFGGFGVAAGLLVGFAGHTVGHRLTHLNLPLERTVAALSAHALAAGSIIGVIYAAMPGLGLVLGLAIVSHKAPAGYAAARRLRRQGTPVGGILLPASGVGLTALPTSVLTPAVAPATRGVVFGFAAGVFLHVAMDFLPRCETGGEIHAAAVERGNGTVDHALLDRLRTHAVASTALGAVAVAAAWAALV
jgi:ZIP family zinc transporter